MALAAGAIVLQIHGGVAEVRGNDLELDDIGSKTPVAVPAAPATIDVPAFTAYLHPEPRGARVAADGISRWGDPVTTLRWYGLIRHPGELAAQVVIGGGDIPPPKVSLTVGGETRAGTPLEGDPRRIDFGTFTIATRGHEPFVLRLDEQPASPLRVDRLVVTGPAAVDAHFNLQQRRNAASVHLAYPIDPQADVRAIYSEVTAIEDPIHTFYMACGWHRGYFGMQVNSPTERRIIFSVWDSGGEAVDRRRVAHENRVRLVAKGDGVVSGDFGNEGTGGHSHLKFPWKTGETQRFLVTATPLASGRAVFAGYWFHPDDRTWMLISAWDAPREHGRLRGYHGFSENFSGETGDLPRKSLHGNQWYRTADGAWHEITRATFSHDATGETDRLDRCMGVEDGCFFLAHGGFLDGFTRYGDAFDRPAGGQPPADLDLPPLPASSVDPR